MRNHANIITETRKLLAVIEEERRLHLAAMERLSSLVLEAVEADALGRSEMERRIACKTLLDEAHESLGDCEPAELLCALLGYEETDEDGPAITGIKPS